MVLGQGWQAGEATGGDAVKLLSSYGGVWKLSNAAYKRFLKAVIDGKEWDLNVYGKFLGHVESVTDITAEQAQELLDEVS